MSSETLEDLREEFMEGDEPVVAVMGLDLARKAAADWEQGVPVAPGVLKMVWWLADALIAAHSEELSEKSLAAVEKIRELAGPYRPGCH